MNKSPAITFLVLLALGVLTACQRDVRPVHAALAALPQNIVWAWERPEDVRWLPTEVGVAYVATAILLVDERAQIRSRGSALQVRTGAVLIPVVHVDASWQHPPVLSDAQRDSVVAQVMRIAQKTGAKVIQLDFEVRRSQRQFLLDVVTAVRAQLPADRALSVTALASWCAGDYWLATMPADEIVPMAFRMGSDDATIRQLLAKQGRFPRPRCQAAVGLATDEPAPRLGSGRRYFFSPVAWTPDIWRSVGHH